MIYLMIARSLIPYWIIPMKPFKKDAYAVVISLIIVLDVASVIGTPVLSSIKAQSSVELNSRNISLPLLFTTKSRLPYQVLTPLLIQPCDF